MIYRLSACSPHAQGMAVLVRATDDEPLTLIAVAASAAVVDVVHEDSNKHALIGVPRRRVFAHNADLFQQLSTCFADGRHDTLCSLWEHAMAADLGHLPRRVSTNTQATNPR
jgi:hypothetical protein